MKPASSQLGGAVTFADAVEIAKEIVKLSREDEKADVIVCLSHGGVVKKKDGRFTLNPAR
jgi:5'-nucleotidase / UDP-sugar diphosphatase